MKRWIVRKPSRRLPGSVLLLTLGLLVPASTLHAVRADLSSLLFFRTTGTANPDLTYHFQGRNEATITSATLVEALLPAVLAGSILKDTVTVDSCLNGGIVEHLFFRCWVPAFDQELSIGCPAAESRWFSAAQLTTGTQVFGAISGPTVANCPPVCTDTSFLTASAVTSRESSALAAGSSPVNPDFEASLVTAIDLGTGLQVDRSLARDLPRGSLHRVERRNGVNFVQDEYAIVEISESRVEVSGASSDRSREAISSWARNLERREPDGDTAWKDGSFLVIQGMEHLTGERRPQIVFRAPEGDFPMAQGERLVVRATFSAEGVLESVATLWGNSDLTWRLARRVEPVFMQGSEHRMVLYAAFEGGPRPRLTAAVPSFPQCCCDGFLCEP